jgi:hypothetical protein
MIVGAQLMTVDAWTHACAVDQFYKKGRFISPPSLIFIAFWFFLAKWKKVKGMKKLVRMLLALAILAEVLIGCAGLPGVDPPPLTEEMQRHNKEAGGGGM